MKIITFQRCLVTCKCST